MKRVRESWNRGPQDVISRLHRCVISQKTRPHHIGLQPRLPPHCPHPITPSSFGLKTVSHRRLHQGRKPWLSLLRLSWVGSEMVGGGCGGIRPVNLIFFGNMLPQFSATVNTRRPRTSCSAVPGKRWTTQRHATHVKSQENWPPGGSLPKPASKTQVFRDDRTSHPRCERCREKFHRSSAPKLATDSSKV